MKRNKLMLSGIFGLFLLLSLSMVSAGFCYQEDATVSNACGGLDSGSYASSGSWLPTFPPLFAYDNDWDGSPAHAVDGTSYVYMTYDRPLNALFGTKWKIKHSDDEYQIIIPQECWKDQIELRVESSSLNAGNLRISQPGCFNGVSWIDVGTRHEGADFFYGDIYEEGVYWKGPEVVQVDPYETLTLPQVVSSVPLDMEGLQRTYLYCTWSIDGIGEETFKMTSESCPETPQDFTFDGDETYYARIEAFHTEWDPVLEYWPFLAGSPETAGIVEVEYQMNEPPEPSQAFFDNVLDIVVSKVKGWICAIFPGLNMCSA